MMKKLLIGVFLFLPFLGKAQQTDSILFELEIDSLYKNAEQLISEEKWDELIQLGQMAEEKIINQFGSSHILIGKVYHYQGHGLHERSHFNKAIEKFEQSISLHRSLNKKDKTYYSSLNIMGISLTQTGQYQKAIVAYMENLRNNEKVYGKGHWKFAAASMNIAITYWNSGDLETADSFLTDAIKVFEEEIKDTEHGVYGNCLLMKGNLKATKYQYEPALELFQKALPVLEKSYGKNNEGYATTLGNIGITYKTLGEYDKSELYFLDAIGIFENGMKNTNHPTYHKWLQEIGAIKMELRNYEDAEKYFLKTLGILEKTLGKNHPSVYISKTYLGLLYQMTGKIENSQRMYDEAFDILKYSEKKATDEYIGYLINSAVNATKTNDFQKADSLFHLANQEFDKIGTKEKHQYYPKMLGAKGSLATDKGDYAMAEEILKQQYEIWMNIFGDQYLHLNEPLRALSKIYYNKGEYEKAAYCYAKMISLSNSIIFKSKYHLSENELSKLLNSYLSERSAIFELAGKIVDNDPDFIGLCYDNTLFYKGFLLSSIYKAKRLARKNPTTINTLNKLNRVKRMLANEYTKPLTERKNISELETKAEKFEKELARMVKGLDENSYLPDWQSVKKKLSPTEAAVEFVNYCVPETEGKYTFKYAALILSSETETPLFIPLIEEKRLGELLYRQDTEKAGTFNNIYKNQSLYISLWQPLEKKLAGIKTIYYSPSGLLHRLNLNAIKINENTTLADRYKLIQLNSTRQLVIPSTIDNKTNNALLFGGINYNMDTTEIVAANYDNDLNKITTRGSLNFSQSDSTMRGGSWDYLDWTEIEVSAIESILKENNINTTLRDGYQATEEAFKSIAFPSPRILHIATHGFFFPDPQRVDSPLGAEGESEPVFKISDHPMIRSGLIMAGGNHAWQTGKPFKPNMEDGVLTAYEISQMDLSNTELVVLSACETGLGDIEGNEGVYGLQRAFKIAGAKYLIMSLWQVPDYQTQELMKAFYKNWLNEKTHIPDAFRAAQQMMKEKYDDPFLWAGFVLVE